MTVIKQPTSKNVILAAKNLMNGALIGLPTETVYGLAADADNENAVRRIYEVKKRPVSHPLIVHIGSQKFLEKWVDEIPDFALKISEAFWPGPLTLILNGKNSMNSIFTGGQKTIAIRFPNHHVTNQLLKHFHSLGGKGIVAPSANIFGKVSPTSAFDVYEDIGDKLNPETDLILDGGKCEIGLESTILDCVSYPPKILRPGYISKIQIMQAIQIEVNDKYKPSKIKFSGSYDKHYSPKAKIQIQGEPLPGSGFLALSNINTPSGCIRLSSPINQKIFAANLYSAFRSADARDLSIIYVVIPSGEEISEVIRDRVMRAANLTEKSV